MDQPPVTLLRLMSCGVCLLAVAQAEELPRPTVTRQAMDLLKSEIKYNPVPVSDPVPAGGEEVVVMERLTVVASLQHRDLHASLQKHALEAAAKKFSVLSGGALLDKQIENYRVEVGTFGTSSGIKLLKLSW